ncbi:MAG TPA: hypothetical protein VFW13_14430, partial [Phenylobacterium sp.]|nr:hypothetical protein [Phenylobacterium sp.]
AVRNPALQQLQNLMSADQGSDAWTKEAQDFINSTSPGDLGLVLADNSDAGMAKAMETLKEVAEVGSAFVAAIKAGKVSTWNAAGAVKTVKDKDAANDLMGQALDTTA